MRSPEMQALDVLVGPWQVTLSNPSFDLPPEAFEPSPAVGTWLGEAFVLLEWPAGEMTLCFGRSSAHDAYWALYHDQRGMDRLFAMTFDDGAWTLLRQDPDFHQRFVAEVQPGRITARWEASEDEGGTWRKDFDLTFVRGAGG